MVNISRESTLLYSCFLHLLAQALIPHVFDSYDDEEFKYY